MIVVDSVRLGVASEGNPFPEVWKILCVFSGVDGKLDIESLLLSLLVAISVDVDKQ